MVAYKADGVTALSDFPSSVGGGYSPIRVEMDTFTVSTALSTSDTIEFMTVPSGYKVLDVWVDTSAALGTGGALFDLGTSGNDDLYMDGIACDVAFNDRMGSLNAGGAAGDSAAVPAVGTDTAIIGSLSNDTGATTGAVITVTVMMIILLEILAVILHNP